MIKKATWSTPKKSGYQSHNPIIREADALIAKKKKGVPVILEVIKTPKKKRMPQYGDKNYRPATGSGTSY